MSALCVSMYVYIRIQPCLMFNSLRFWLLNCRCKARSQGIQAGAAPWQTSPAAQEPRRRQHHPSWLSPSILISFSHRSGRSADQARRKLSLPLGTVVKLRAAMDARQWVRQWARLARQEAELGPGPQGGQQSERAPLGSARGPPGAPGAPGQQLRAQLDRQLAAAQALSAQQAAGEAAPALYRRRRQVSEALAQLATACAAQLQELDALESQLSAEYEEAAGSARQLLAGGAAALAAPAQRGGGTAAEQPDCPGASGPAAAAAPTRSGSSLPPEVVAHDTFLQRHGPKGGWHPDDHAEFERILRSCRGNYAHAAQLCTEQLGLLHSAADIAAHARWHEELQRLALAKRMAVQRWRLARQAEQAALLEQAQAGADCEQHPQGQASEAAGQQQQRWQQEEQRAAVAEWRAARDREVQEALQRQAAEEQERRQREAAARQRRQEENRQLLERRAAERGAAAQKQGQLSAESSAGSGAGTARSSACSASSSVDSAARQRLRDRNQQLLERRAAAVRRRSQQAAEHAERVEQLARRASEQFQFGAGVGRDPARLLQATSAAALRTLAALGEERGPRDSGFIRHLPRRATPSWCAGARLQ
ncbi:hypothetical protein ABPG75_010719 [Micractinium tetrahymenae]